MELCVVLVSLTLVIFNCCYGHHTHFTVRHHHRGYVVARLSPVIEAVGVTGIPPCNCDHRT